MTTERFDGLTIEINDNLADMERWILGDEGNDPVVDFDATIEQYTKQLRAVLHEAYPGVRVTYRLTNGGGRTTISGQGDDLAYTQLHGDLDLGRLDEVLQMVCPDGDPLPFIVTTDET